VYKSWFYLEKNLKFKVKAKIIGQNFGWKNLAVGVECRKE
jgi:hypothetical protein